MTETGGRRWSERRIILAGAAFAIVVAVALTLLSATGFKPDGPDTWTYDWRTYMFSKREAAPRKDIAIVFIGEDSLADYDYVSPADRGMLAKLIQALDEAKPKAIGLDFVFDRKSEPAKTQALIDAIKAARTPIVIGAIDKRGVLFKDNTLRNQEEFLKATGRTAGHVYFARDIETVKISDQVVRYLGEPSRDPPYRRSLSTELADIGRKTPEPGTPYIAWLLPPAGDDLFPTFYVPRHDPSAGPDVILPPSWRPALKDKIVLVGGDFWDRDRHLTPLAIWDGVRIPGVLIQAQILAQRLDGRTVKKLSSGVEFLILLVATFLSYVISQQWQSRRLDMLFYCVGVVVFVLIGIGLFWAYSIILPTTFLFLAWTAGVSGARMVKEVMRRLGLDVADAPQVTVSGRPA